MAQTQTISRKPKAQVILQKAKALANTCRTWADLSNSLFDPLSGLVVHTFSDPDERGHFRKTKTYDRLHALVEKKMHATGVVQGAKPTKSGRFVVRLPQSLHTALDREAKGEGVSLNQLVVTKLAIQLENLSGGRLASIIQAFGEVREGCSSDRVIADPQMNKKFLRHCRQLGLSGTDFDLNWALMSARKSGQLSNLPKTKRYTLRNTDEYEYATELAVQHLQITRGVSLDRIICDPELAEEFDKYARRLASGFSPLEYRWVALGLRKAGRLKEVKSLPKLQPIGRVNTISASQLPEERGIYLFSSSSSPVFMGQTENLRHRLERHMEASSSQGLPLWLWDTVKKPLDLSIATLPDLQRSARQAIETLLVRENHPLLNFSRKVA